MISAETEDLYRAMNEYGHNGASARGLWGAEALEDDKLAAFVAEQDAERGCPGRTYSSSTAEAREMYDEFDQGEWGIEASLEYYTGEVPEEARQDAERFRQVIHDEDHVAVYASHYDEDGGDYAVSCFYFDHYILQESGEVIRFRVDLTD